MAAVCGVRVRVCVSCVRIVYVCAFGLWYIRRPDDRGLAFLPQQVQQQLRDVLLPELVQLGLVERLEEVGREEPRALQHAEPLIVLLLGNA